MKMPINMENKINKEHRGGGIFKRGYVFLRGPEGMRKGLQRRSITTKWIEHPLKQNLSLHRHREINFRRLRLSLLRIKQQRLSPRVSWR